MFLKSFIVIQLLSFAFLLQLDCKFLDERNPVLKYYCTTQPRHSKTLVDLFMLDLSDDRNKETHTVVQFAIQSLIKLAH